VTRCPRLEIDDDALDAIEAADRLETLRMPPVVGGYMEQTLCWAEAVTFVRAERAKLSE
jgi:hypothetical protein